MTPPLLIVAVGNPSRGDDALGPALLQALRDAGVGQGGEVEWLTDFQLQIEHALDLDGRAAVLFVDAALPGAAHGASLTRIDADASALAWTSHALRPQALLGVYARVQGREAPPAWQLAIEGAQFELGTGLSPTARQHLQDATALAMGWMNAAQALASEAGRSAA